MLSEMSDRGNKQDWERFFNRFEAFRFRENASNDDLHYILSIMADYNRPKFDQYIFDFACRELESRGINPSDDVSLLYPLMRGKFLEVGLKLYSFYKENPYRLHIDVADDGFKHRGLEMEDDSIEGRNLIKCEVWPVLKMKPFKPSIVR